jgi:ferritin
MLMRQYLINNGERVTFGEVAKPDKTYNGLGDPLKAGLEHEQYVTSLINKIYKAADDVDDYRTMQCFDWFVKEQGEEEKNADDLIKKFKLFGSDPKALYALDQELMARVYAAPTLTL